LPVVDDGVAEGEVDDAVGEALEGDPCEDALALLDVGEVGGCGGEGGGAQQSHLSAAGVRGCG
jgi:hypothetical protein